MAGGIDLRSGFVDSAMDRKAGSVYGHLVSTNYLAILVHLDHVLCREKSEMISHPKSVKSSLLYNIHGYSRIDPECARVDRVTEADVSSGTLGVSFTSENSERSSHMLQLPLPFFVLVLEFWHSREGITPSGPFRI